MKRSLYSVKDREVDYVEGRSSNSSSNSSQCAAPSKEQNQRLKQGINTSDLWNNFVKDNWAPVLESAFGTDWANKYPEEVTAILWWALNYRSRAHVGHAGTDASNQQHTIANVHSNPNDTAAPISLSSTHGEKGSNPACNKFSFGLDQPPEFVIGCNTPTSRSSSKEAFHQPSSLAVQSASHTSTATFCSDAHTKQPSTPMKLPAPVVTSAADVAALESALASSQASMADVGDIMQQIQHELESRIMLCDVSLDMGVAGEMDLPDLSPHELLERSGLAALLPMSAQLPTLSNIPMVQSSLPLASSSYTIARQTAEDQSTSSQQQSSVSPHVVLIPTAPTLGLQQLAFSLSSSLSLMQDNLSELASQYSPTAAAAASNNAATQEHTASQAALPQISTSSPDELSAHSAGTSAGQGPAAVETPTGKHSISSTGESSEDEPASGVSNQPNTGQPCAESVISQDEQPCSSQSPSPVSMLPAPPSSLLSIPPLSQEAVRVPAPSASTFTSVSSLPNPFAPASLTPPHSLFLNTPTSSIAPGPTPFTSTPSSSSAPSFTTPPIFTSLNLSSSSPAAPPVNPTLTPSPSAEHVFTTLPPTSSSICSGPSAAHPQTAGLPQFGLYVPTIQPSNHQQAAYGSTAVVSTAYPSSTGPTTPHNTTLTAPSPAAAVPANSMMVPGATSTSLPMASQGLCNMLCAMGNALALQYVPVQLVAAGNTQARLAGAMPSSSNPAATPPPPVYLMDSLVSGHTFQSIVDGVDSMGRAPLHVAAAAGRADVVEQLMYVGCDCTKALQADFPLDQKLSHAGLQRLSDFLAALHNGEPIRGIVPGYEQPPSFVGCTALHLAAYFGNLEVVDLLLRSPGVDIKATSDCGMTALHMAANQGHAHVLARLCKVPGAEVDALDIMGCTALHHAAALGHAAVLDQLWPRGADLEALDPKLRTPLHLAAEAGHTDVVSKLVIAGCHVQKYNKDGLTAGHLAAMYGYGDVLEKLLLAGYEVDCPAGPALITGIVGATPLHLSAAAGHVNVLSLLLSNGANVAKQEARGATPLYCAAEGAQPAAFQMLLQAGSDIHVADCQAASVLHAAAKGGNCEIIQQLLELGCNVTAVTHSGENVLHYAAKAGELEACKRLLDCGASSTALDAAGNAPWHVAAMEGHHEVLELFLSHGVPLELPTLTGSTALHCSAAGGHLVAVRLLLDRGAAPEATCTQQQQSALHVAARMDSLEVLQLLLQSVQKDAVNVQDVHGCTPLHYAAQQGTGMMLELLIDAGADPNVGSKEGQTPLHLATKQQHLEAVECLLSHGCVAATCDVHGCNALHYAAQNAHLPLFQLLSQQPGTLVKEKARSGFTLLHYAVEGGSIEAVQMLLSAGVGEVDDCQGLEGQNNALHMACKLGKLDIVKVLLLAGYSPTARGSEGRQPLHWAAFGSRLVPANARKGADYYGVLQLLLVSGVDVHAIDEHQCNAVMYAAGSGEVKVLEQLLQLGCNPLLQDMTGWTALHWAATGENGSVIPMLLQLGCPLGTVDQHGRLALHWAAEKGLMAAVTALVDAMLDAGLDVHVLDASGSSPAQLAACQGHVEVVAKLLETGKTKEVKGLTALHLAAQNGLDQVVAQLLAVAGCDVNVRDGDGLTPLHWAATRGAIPVLQQLINGGADINAASTDGWMALHKAASAGHLATVELLISCGSVINFKTSNGSTPLHYAASNGHTAVATQLIAAGCPVNAKSSAGCTALYCAASAGHLDATEELLKANAEVDALTTTGCTALHIAASNGHGKVVQRLVAAGADMDIQASNGSCALHNAVQNGHVEVVEVLMAVGCDWDIQNSNGNTALHIAASKGNMDIVNKLLGAGCDVHIKNSKQWQAVHSAANNGYFDVVLRLVQHGAIWKTKGEADVVRMLVRKSSLKISYVEGRLRLAEREKQRLKKAPAHVAEHPSGSKPNDDELRQLSQQADANMAALLEEEAARREAQEAAAERRKAKKKSKKKKNPKEASAKGLSAPSTEGEADDADDEQGASDGRSLADEQQALNACQFDLELGSDTPPEPEPGGAGPKVSVDTNAGAVSEPSGTTTNGRAGSAARRKTSASGPTSTGASSPDGEEGGKNVSLMQMIANLRISGAAPAADSVPASSFKPGSSAPGQYGSTGENGTKEQASRSLPASQARERAKQVASKEKAGSSKLQHAKGANGSMQPSKASQKASSHLKQEAAAAKNEPQSKPSSEPQTSRSQPNSVSSKVQPSSGKPELVSSSPPQLPPAGSPVSRKAAKSQQAKQQLLTQEVPAAQARAAATATTDTKKDKASSSLTDRPHTAPAAGTRSIPTPVSSAPTQPSKADELSVRSLTKSDELPVKPMTKQSEPGSGAEAPSSRPPGRPQGVNKSQQAAGTAASSTATTHSAAGSIRNQASATAAERTGTTAGSKHQSPSSSGAAPAGVTRHHGPSSSAAPGTVSLSVGSKQEPGARHGAAMSSAPAQTASSRHQTPASTASASTSQTGSHKHPTPASGAAAATTSQAAINKQPPIGSNATAASSHAANKQAPGAPLPAAATSHSLAKHQPPGSNHAGMAPSHAGNKQPPAGAHSGSSVAGSHTGSKHQPVGTQFTGTGAMQASNKQPSSGAHLTPTHAANKQPTATMHPAVTAPKPASKHQPSAGNSSSVAHAADSTAAGTRSSTSAGEASSSAAAAKAANIQVMSTVAAAVAAAAAACSSPSISSLDDQGSRQDVHSGNVSAPASTLSSPLKSRDADLSLGTSKVRRTGDVARQGAVGGRTGTAGPASAGAQQPAIAMAAPNPRAKQQGGKGVAAVDADSAGPVDTKARAQSSGPHHSGDVHHTAGRQPAALHEAGPVGAARHKQDAAKVAVRGAGTLPDNHVGGQHTGDGGKGARGGSASGNDGAGDHHKGDGVKLSVRGSAASFDSTVGGQHKADSSKAAVRAVTPPVSAVSITSHVEKPSREAGGSPVDLPPSKKPAPTAAAPATSGSATTDLKKEEGIVALKLPMAVTSGTLSASAASFVPSSLSKAWSSNTESAQGNPVRFNRSETASQAAPAAQAAPLSYSAAVAPYSTTRTSTFHRPSHAATASTPLVGSPLLASSAGPDLSRPHARKAAWGQAVGPPSTSAALVNTSSPRTSSPLPNPVSTRPPSSLQSQTSGRLSTSPASCPIEPLPRTALTSAPAPPSVPPYIPNSAASLNPWGPVPESLDRISATTAVPLTTSWTLPTTLSHPITVGLPSRPVHPYINATPQSVDWSNGVLPIGNSRAATLANRQPIDWSFAPSTSTGSMFPSSAGSGQSDPSAPEPLNAKGMTAVGASASPTHRTASAASSSSWQLQSHILRSHSSSGLTGMGGMDSTVSHSLPTAIQSTSIWSFNTSHNGSGAFARPSGPAGMIQPVARSLFNDRGQLVGSLDSSSGSSGKGAVRLSTQVSDQYRCPISKKIMQDPVVAGDGYTYERAAIEEWLQKYDISPITNSQFVSKELVPNMTMRAAIQLLATQ